MCDANKFTRTAFMGLWLGLAAGCGSGVTGSAPPDAVVYADNLIILTDDSPLQFESLDAMTLRFSFSGGDPGVVSGDILSGTTGEPDGAYLRRVESIEQSSDGVLIINTTQATVDDAVEEGHFELKIVIGTADANVSGKQQTVLQIGAAEERDISGELYNNGVLVVDIPSGTIGFSAEIDWDVDYEIFGGLESFSATFDGTVELDLDVVISASAAGCYHEEVELFALPPQYFLVGIIAGQVNVIFEAGLDVDASVAGAVETGLDASATVALGGHYDSEGWRTSYLPPSTDFNSHEWDWNLDGTVGARIFVRPKVEILFYSLVGPVFDLEPYLTFEVNVDECSFDWDLTGGVSSHLSIELGPLSDSVPPLLEVELFDSHESIASDQGGTIAISMFDIDRDGWTVVGDSAAIPDWVADGGNLGGYIEATDEVVGGVWFWEAPSKFLGDVSAAFGGILSFDLRQSDTSDPFSGETVILSSGTTTIELYYSNPDTQWTSYLARLDASTNWRLGDESGTRATDEDILAVLGSLESLLIRGEYRVGPDIGGLDNVILTPCTGGGL